MADQTTASRPPRQMPKFFNQVMSFILRSPLHNMISSQIMLLTFQGRKSGKQYTTPVGYMRDGQQITFFTDHQWWKNLRNSAPVSMRVQGRALHGKAEAVLDKTETQSELRRYLERLPNASRAFSVEKDSSGAFDQASLEDAVRRFTMVRIQLDEA